ncbi:MAG: winged helix-turn-helix domain-containing protein [Archaeoglobaceae archaeon]
MNDIFRALSSPTRREMLKILFNEEVHITGLARKVSISTPAAIKHIKILEEAGLIHKRELGRMHLLRAKKEKVFSLLEELQEPISIEVDEGASVLDALRKVSGVSVSEAGDKEYVMAIDGEKGYFVYEVDGNISDLPMNQCKLEGNKEVRLKELVPVTRKNLEVKVKNKE